MNGDIKVTSRVGKGSLFKIMLFDVDVAPVSVRTESSIIPFDISQTIFEPDTILVVDDIESNRVLIRESLTITGLKILEAENGQQAIIMAEESFPKVILMDIRMPVMDGYEALNKLKDNAITKSIPVIALTASVSIGDADKMKQFGFDGYLPKPVQFNDLCSELNRYIKYLKKGESTKPRSATVNKKNLKKNWVEGIENLIGLIDTITSKIMPQWDSLDGAMEIDAIENFAKDLLKLSETHHCNLLKEYSGLLLEHVETFNVDQIGQSLNEFPAVFNQVKGEISIENSK